MTIKSIKDLGFTVIKKPNQKFILAKGEARAEVTKITDTKFSYENNEPTADLDQLIKQIPVFNVNSPL